MMSRKMSDTEQQLANIKRMLLKKHYKNNTHRYEIYHSCYFWLDYKYHHDKENWKENDTKNLKILEKDVEIIYLLQSSWLYTNKSEIERLTEGYPQMYVQYDSQKKQFSAMPSLQGKQVDHIKSLLGELVRGHSSPQNNDPISYIDNIRYDPESTIYLEDPETVNQLKPKTSGGKRRRKSTSKSS